MRGRGRGDGAAGGVGEQQLANEVLRDTAGPDAGLGDLAMRFGLFSKETHSNVHPFDKRKAAAMPLNLAAIHLGVMHGAAKKLDFESRGLWQPAMLVTFREYFTPMPPTRTIVVMMAHAFTPSMKERIVSFASSCANAGTCVVHVSVDLTRYVKGDRASPSEADKLLDYCRKSQPQLLGSWLHVHGWTSAEIEARWPEIDSALATMPPGTAVGWGFSTEVLTNWYLGILSTRWRQELEYVWYLESDVGYCGNDMAGLLTTCELLTQYPAAPNVDPVPLHAPRPNHLVHPRCLFRPHPPPSDFF